MEPTLKVPPLIVIFPLLFRALRAYFSDGRNNVLLLVPSRYYGRLLVVFFEEVDPFMVELVLLRSFLHDLNEVEKLVVPLRFLDTLDDLVAVGNLSSSFRFDDCVLPLQVGTHVQRVSVSRTPLFLHAI